MKKDDSPWLYKFAKIQGILLISLMIAIAVVVIVLIIIVLAIICGGDIDVSGWSFSGGSSSKKKKKDLKQNF